MQRIAAVWCRHPVGPWYRAGEARGPGPGAEALLVPLVFWALARGGADPPFLVAAAASLGRLLHSEDDSVSDACLLALALQEVAVSGRVPPDFERRADLRALAQRWGGAAPTPRAFAALQAAATHPGDPEAASLATAEGPSSPAGALWPGRRRTHRPHPRGDPRLARCAHGRAMTRERRAALLAFLTAFVTLFVQVLVHRMVSVKLLNNYAFLVISLTMLGFASSAVVLTRWRSRLLDFDRVFPWAAALFALTLVGTSLLFYRAPNPESSSSPARTWCSSCWRASPGRCSSPCLSSSAGSSWGSSSPIRSSPPGGSTSTTSWARPWGGRGHPRDRHGGRGKERHGGRVVLLAGVLALPGRLPGRALATVAGARALPGRRDLRAPALRHELSAAVAARPDPGAGQRLRPRRSVLGPDLSDRGRTSSPRSRPLHLARPGGHQPGLPGAVPTMLTQNNNAFTYAVEYDGDVDSLAGIEETMYAAAYKPARSPPRACSSSGWAAGDVLTGLRYAPAALTGVEVNRATLTCRVRHYRDYFRAGRTSPRPSRAGRREALPGRESLALRLIQLSGVDSVSGTPGAAHVFSENYLYSSEAFDLYLTRLDGRRDPERHAPGILPPRKTPRVLVTAVAALRRAGIERPADHVMMVALVAGNFTALLLKRTPFTPEAGTAAGVDGRELRVLPGRGSGSSLPGNLYQAYLSLADPRRERAFVAAFSFDVCPSDDDRPFFFRFTRWSHLFSRNPVLHGPAPHGDEPARPARDHGAGGRALRVPAAPFPHPDRCGLADAPRLTLYFAGWASATWPWR